MAMRGDRFELDLSSDDSADDQPSSNQHQKKPPPTNPASFSFIGDIKERAPSSTARSPAPPKPKSSATGFPAHRKRTQGSLFKQQRSSARREDQKKEDEAAASPLTLDATPPAPTVSSGSTKGAGLSEQRERQEIDQENQRTLANMSEEEINQEKQELLAGLDPSLVQRLLRRANIDDSPQEQTRQVRFVPDSKPIPDLQPPNESSPLQSSSPPPAPPPTASNEPVADEAPTSPPADLHPASELPLASQPNVHFPGPPQVPDLDPNSDSFLESLHSKYFPTLAADPSKLAWMAPVTNSSSIETSPYSPSQTSLAPSDIRFSFRGTLLPPRTAADIPAHLGLHHHGDAPEAAGYTIPELARLARSAYPAQRCLAFQTLGRILYRLGRGEFGPEGDDLVIGLWRCVHDGGVLKTLADEAATEPERGAHLSARAHAIEAVWNWQRGGGRKWKAQ